MSTFELPLWDVREVSKSYPGVKANDHVSIRLMAGRIHGLLGENGCGKSTLIRLLSGVDVPDEGQILVDGKPVVTTTPTEARALGVATVFQEFSINPTMTIAENVFLGRWPHNRFGLVDWRRMSQETRRLMASLDISLDPEHVVSDLSVAQQQLVEIVKAVAQSARLFILDEPTTALGLDEIEHLHKLLRRMRDQGCAILYVSHRLDEVTALVDEVTIMRGGKVVGHPDKTDVSIDAIVSAMIGSDVKEHYPKQHNARTSIALEVDRISSENDVSDVSFQLRQGEVLGLGGVVGSGRTEIARAIFGVDPITSGRILVEGREVRIKTPADAIAAGLGMVTENRKSDGLFFNFDGRRNISSASLPRLSPGGILQLRRESADATELSKSLQISSGGIAKLVGQLSGGNQQKMVIGRWLSAGAKILIFDEPTQGIDIGAKLAVYNLINQLTAQGCGIILISSDHEELLAMSDRVAIIQHGTVQGIRDPKDLDHTDLVRAAAVVTHEEQREVA